MNEIKQLLIEQIESYEKMMEDNQDKAIQLQEQITYFNEVNKKHHQKIKDLTKKLRELN